MKESLESRIKKQVGKTAAPSMVPDFNPPPPPPKEEEIVPDIRELVNSTKDRLELLRLISDSAAWAQQEREAKKQRKPLTENIKRLLGKYEIGKCQADGIFVNYYNVPRSSLSREALLSHGVSPQILEACTVTKDSYTLRITAPGDSEDDS